MLWGFDYNKKIMPVFRIYRMKDAPRQQFRWAPHLSGCAALKLKDYEQRGEIEALHEYAAWRELRERGDALQVGDLLENPNGQLRICKYVGFEPAEWVVPAPADSGSANAPPVETVSSPQSSAT
jgi:hypothetical protein